MASAIDATKPTAGSALTQDVRDNFSAADSEITALQAATTNIDNTSDANKPISTATQTALDLKATIVSLDLKDDIAWEAVDTSGFTFVSGGKHLCDVTAGAFTATLPATLAVGDRVSAHAYGDDGTNLLTIARNSHTITFKGVNVDSVGDGNLTLAEGESVVLVATSTGIMEIV